MPKVVNWTTVDDFGSVNSVVINGHNYFSSSGKMNIAKPMGYWTRSAEDKNRAMDMMHRLFEFFGCYLLMDYIPINFFKDLFNGCHLI